MDRGPCDAPLLRRLNTVSLVPPLPLPLVLLLLLPLALPLI